MKNETGVAAERLKLRLLGDFRVAVDDRYVNGTGWGRRAAADLVKFLAIEPGHTVHPEVLAESLWPELSRHAATNKLHKGIHAARRALEPGLGPHIRSRYITTSDSTVSLTCAEIDVDRFEKLAQSALRSGSEDDIDTALALYAGPLLPGDRYEEWTLVRRGQLQSLHRRLVLMQVQNFESQGRFAAAIEYLSTLLVEDRADETVHRRIIALHGRSGNSDEALRQYEMMRDALMDEMGALPSADSERVRAEIELARQNRDGLVPQPRAFLKGHAEANAQLGQTLALAGRYEESLECLQKAEKMFRELHDADGQAHVLATLGHVQLTRARPDEGIAMLEALNPAPLSTGAYAGVLASLAGLYWLRCEYGRQLDLAEAAESRAADAADARVHVEARVWRGVALVALERIDQGLNVLEGAAMKAESLGEAESASRALNTIAAVLHERGDYERERQYVERSLVNAARSGDPSRLTFMLYRVGWNAYNLGHWNDAELYLARAVAVSESFPGMWSRAYALHGLAWLHLCRGEHERARLQAEAALSEVSLSGDRRAEWSLQGLLGTLSMKENEFDRSAELLGLALSGPGLTEADQSVLLASMALVDLHRRRVDEARQRVVRAVDLADSSGAKPALFESRLAEAIISRVVGDPNAAERAIYRAEQMALEMKQPYFEARALWERSLIAETNGRDSLAESYRERAVRLFESLGVRLDACHPDLQRGSSRHHVAWWYPDAGS